MLGIFSNICFFQNFQKIHCFHPFFLLIYNLNIKQFGSQMKPYILCGFIWIQIVCKGHQRSSKFTASRLRAKVPAFRPVALTSYLTFNSGFTHLKFSQLKHIIRALEGITATMASRAQSYLLFSQVTLEVFSYILQHLRNCTLLRNKHHRP